MIPIVGAHFRPPAKAILAQLPVGCDLVVTPEPDNAYDSNALAIFVETKSIPPTVYPDLAQEAIGYGFSLDEILAKPAWHLGYIPRDLAATLAPKFGSDPRPGKLKFTSTGKPAVELEEIT